MTLPTSLIDLEATTDSVLEKLLQGYQQFREKYFSHSLLAAGFKTLVKNGQQPKVMLISCSDSRVDPSVIFDCEPGDLFVVRNVANLVPPCDPHPRHHSTSAALEFAVKHLGVQHIIVLGHSQCGGIKALMETDDGESAEKEHKSFIYNWVQIAAGAKHHVLEAYAHAHPAEQAQHCEEEALRVSFQNLQTFPWILEKVQAGALHIHAWRLDLETGNLQRLASDTDAFETFVEMPLNETSQQQELNY